MKGKIGIQPDNLTKKKSGVLNRDVAVFVFFLLLSFILWYINSLGKEVEADIRYQIKYTNLPKDRILVEESASRLNLYLKGPGYTIMKLKFTGKKAPVNIDVSKVSYRRVPGSKDMNYYLVTTSLAKSLNVQLRTGCEITSIKPDTLFFTFEKRLANSGKTGSSGKASRTKR